jgi:hypothetical protein
LRGLSLRCVSHTSFMKKENLSDHYYKQLISVDRCVYIQKTARKFEHMDFLKGCLTNLRMLGYLYLLILRADVCLWFSSYKQFLLVGYWNMSTVNVIKSSFACGKICIFQTVNMKQKYRDDIRWLVIWMKVFFFLLLLKFQLFINLSFKLAVLETALTMSMS